MEPLSVRGGKVPNKGGIYGRQLLQLSKLTHRRSTRSVADSRTANWRANDGTTTTSRRRVNDSGLSKDAGRSEETGRSASNGHSFTQIENHEDDLSLRGGIKSSKFASLNSFYNCNSSPTAAAN